MSVLIKGMEMPKSCAFCKIKRRNGKKMVCPLCSEEWDISDPMSADHRLDNCPLVPVPEHGRLKKRLVYRGEVYNALESARANALDGILSDPYKEGFHDGIKRAIQILANEVDDAPTIIPASEEGET